eukprot:GHVQ01025576.1.p1 GENE.GHVQ01025576.1~~GHVQ01025576.1.p1  ORF type:complete len:118 (+),score=19.88 GHVQ01025576.1:176-529(+)
MAFAAPQLPVKDIKKLCVTSGLDNTALIHELLGFYSNQHKHDPQVSGNNDSFIPERVETLRGALENQLVMQEYVNRQDEHKKEGGDAFDWLESPLLIGSMLSARGLHFDNVSSAHSL